MRKLALFAAPFAGAVFASVYLLPQAVRLPVGLFCALAGAGILFRRRGGEARLGAALLTLGLAAGLCWSWGYDWIFLAQAERLVGKTAGVEAVVTDWPTVTAYGVSVEIRFRTENGKMLRALLSLGAEPEYEKLRPGDALAMKAEFRRPDTIGGEKTGYYRAKGIHLLADARSAPKIMPAEKIPVLYWPKLWAKELKNTADTLFCADGAGLVAALIMGDRSGISPEFYAALRRCGLAHTVAVSGMHMGMLVLLPGLLLGRRRRAMALCCIPAVFAFMAMTGFSPSVVRAGVMEILVLLAPALGREGDTLTALAFSLLLLLGQNPYAAMDVGLQLSYLSVAGILTLTGRMNAWLWERLGLQRGKGHIRQAANGAGRFFTGCVTMGLGAAVFTTPLTVWYFGAVSLAAPIANLLTLWAVTGLFLLGLPAAALGAVWLPAGRLLALCAQPLISYLLALVPALSRFPFAAVPAGDNSYLLIWLFFAYGVLFICLFRGGDVLRPAIALCGCALTLAAALWLNAASLDGNMLTVSVLDVGQGQSVLFTSAGNSALIDCGGTGLYNPGDTAADRIQSMGRNRLELFVLTHFHADHANGAAELLRRLDVAVLAVPDVEPDSPVRASLLELARERGTKVLFIHDDRMVSIGKAALRLYAPLGAGGGNEEGLSVLASCGEFDVLITGDMNAVVEHRLVKYGALPDIELLVAGHHGSAAAVSEELLRAVRPEYAVISVGYNTYGHPAPETLERLAAAGCSVYRTDWQGTVTVCGKMKQED